ncbi:hypothetical protein [Chryseobacterium sp. P1-3]|uniref:hypothetical protein n=1 Tax=Chryseobacterium sp. (strain P1-3) TaxID=1517683 RepID=UPI000679B682|nr:hypothetical protein [Chryseobacterium sp. P1-3]
MNNILAVLPQMTRSLKLKKLFWISFQCKRFQSLPTEQTILPGTVQKKEVVAVSSDFPLGNKRMPFSNIFFYRSSFSDYF